MLFFWFVNVVKCVIIFFVCVLICVWFVGFVFNVWCVVFLFVILLNIISLVNELEFKWFVLCKFEEVYLFIVYKFLIEVLVCIFILILFMV